MGVTEIPPVAVVENTTTVASILSNLTTTLLDAASTVTTASQNESVANTTEILKLPEDDDDIHRNPELKYFSTVIIIFMGLTILIVPVFCFIGVVCARARVFATFREVAGRGWGFRDLNVPYSEFGGSEEYPKSASTPVTTSSSSSRNCDVKVLVADDNRVPSRSTTHTSFLRVNASDEDEDISSLPPTFVHPPA